jgi:hypothetical protein
MDQFTSSVVIAELFAGACLLAADGRTEAAGRHLWNLRERVIPAATILPFDVMVAETLWPDSQCVAKSGNSFGGHGHANCRDGKSA